ncbi:hypothetical protein BY458DRAFT_521612 [Sporodiniella umbellata]|nr:hypothetical protein BY458DRAFT_521612 [Sporodiniella umbellata]
MENGNEFEKQYEKLLKDAVKGIEELSTQLDDVDRNLQTIHSLGRQVQQSAILWSDFRRSLRGEFREEK